MSKLTKKKLLDICRENKIRGVSKKNKEYIINLLHGQNLLNGKKLSKKRIILEENPQDEKDPITLEPFEEWTDDEWNQGIFMNGYYYKYETISNYININKEKEKILDPINQSLYIPKEIIERLIIKDKIELKEEDIKIEYENRYIELNQHLYNFTMCFLKIERRGELRDLKIETNLKHTRIMNRYIIGVIPDNISICSWENFPNEIKALDSSSTTEALLIRISQLYQKRKLIKIENEKIKIKNIKSLPYRSIHWFSNDDGFYILDTRPKYECRHRTTYNSLLDELEFLE